jgi:hypothetical protein
MPQTTSGDRKRLTGSRGGPRTPDLCVQSATLSRLSYTTLPNGQAGRSRSCGLKLPELALFQLSYSLIELARTGGLEPPFATPFTVHRFVAGAGYVRMLAEA